MRARLSASLLSALLALGLNACASGPAYQRPALELPSAWEGAGAPETREPQWWRGFASEELSALLDEAVAANYDLRASLHRIGQARATLRAAGAAFVPRVEGSVGASRNYREGGASTRSEQALLSAGYELDLWGANRARAQIARATLGSRELDHAALLLVLQSEVAASYFNALALQERLAIASENLVAAREVLGLVELRYAEGVAGGLELAQQRAAVANIEAQLPALKQQLVGSRHALAVLLGRPPQGFHLQGESLAALRLPIAAAGQPAELLERRPDLRSAEAALIAANGDIAVARAAFYPTARLSAAGGVVGLAGPGTAIASLAANLVGPIFEGGRLQANLDVAQARREELVQRYAQAVLTALGEVEDALAAVAASDARREALSRAAAEAREAYRLANIRYEAGSVDLLTLLDAQRSRLQAEDGLVQARLARFTAAASLYRALGGSWAES
jgi:outer membrane protein, multidrug efflux system